MNNLNCVVCKKPIENDDVFNHIFKQKIGANEFIDNDHEVYSKSVDDKKTSTCICGGHIFTSSSASGGEGWVTECDTCGMVWDED